MEVYFAVNTDKDVVALIKGDFEFHGEGNNCGWYSSEYLTDCNVIATMIINETDSEIEYYLRKKKSHYDVLQIESLCQGCKFVADNDEYAIKAFKFNSFDYLLKPINADELAVAIQKVNRYSSTSQGGSDDIRLLLEHMRKNNYRYRERFLLPYRDGYISVSVKDISHVALDGRNVCLYMKNGTNEKISYSLDELEKQLNPDEFFRVNRQYIVRIDSILSINNWFNSRLKVHLKKYPDTEVVVSRERATALKEWLDR